ncbi:hypothetical protein WJX79_011124 [Trebouxia sp. C0005]
MMAALYENATADLDKMYTKSLAEVGLLVTRYSEGCSRGTFLGGHYAMTPKAVLHSRGKGLVKRCEYFIKCCNCSEVLAARDFPEHTGGKTSDWRSSLRVFEKNGHPRLKDWVADRCKAPDAGQPGVGSRICIFWPTERNWFSGSVAAFDDSEGLSKIQYDDGDTEWLHLAVECYMQPSTGSTEVAGESHLLPFDERVIDLCNSDSEEEILPQQLTGPRSNSAVLIKSEPLLIKPDPGAASTLELQSAQPSQAGRSTGLPQPTHLSRHPQSVQSSTVRPSLQPSASMLSACPAKPALSPHTATALKSIPKFALGVSLDTRNLQDALEELVCHLTDPVTSAKFFAIMDRQSSSDAKESLVRYYGRVSALVEKHHLGGYDEVARVLQIYLTNLCN